MDACFHGLNPAFKHRLDLGVDRFLGVDEVVCLNLQGKGEFRCLPFQAREYPACQRVDGLEQRPLVEHGEWLRCKRGFGLGRRTRQSQVHFASSLAQQFRTARVDATDQILHQFRGGQHIVLQQMGGVAWRCVRQGRALGEHPLQVPGRRIHGQRPGVALAGHPVLEHRQHLRRLLVACRTIFDLSCKWRHIREAGFLAEKPRDLDVGVLALFDFAVHLEEVLVVVNDGGVALLHAERAAVQTRLQRLQVFSHRIRSGADQSATGSVCQSFTPGHQVQKRRLEALVRARVAEHPAVIQRGNRAGRGGGTPRFQSLGGQDLQR